jgi:hypothetical protein
MGKIIWQWYLYLGANLKANIEIYYFIFSNFLVLKMQRDLFCEQISLNVLSTFLLQVQQSLDLWNLNINYYTLIKEIRIIPASQ